MLAAALVPALEAQTGTIVIAKATDPAGGTGFGFTDDIASPNSFSLDDGGSQTFMNVVPGTYTVTEGDPTVSPGGFDLTALTCVDSDAGGTASSTSVATRTATINLDPGETVTCTFTNTERGTIVVAKATDPAGGTGFGFTDDIASPNSFSLDDGGSQTFMNVVPGTYTVTEGDPTVSPGGFDLTALTCVDSDAGGTASSTSVGTRTATIELDPGETVTCTFTNTGSDFGDAPDPLVETAGEYPTLLANDGARHIARGALLGAARDGELDGQPNSTATGDDAAGATPDDEDGVVFTSPLVRGQTATVAVTATGSGRLNAWVDFDGNGSWLDAGEQIFTDELLSSGLNNLTFPVPAEAVPTTATFARFRFDQGGGLSPTGLAPDGEVEDYAVEIVKPAIGDTVWCDDVTVNGSFDAGEGLNNITVILLPDEDCDNIGEEPSLATRSTSGDGQYLFDELLDDGTPVDLPVGTAADPVCYVVSVDVTDPELGTCTAPFTPISFQPDLTIAAPRSLTNDFGFVEPSALKEFEKSFSPDTIGPGGVSTLTFTLRNLGTANPLMNVNFTDDLPMGVTIASPSNAGTDCPDVSTLGVATVIAPEGGSLIEFQNGGLAPAASCTVVVDVTASLPATYMNTSSDLNSNIGTTDPATADLIVATDRPGFSKSFSPASVPFGGRSTLTFTIDNSANGSPAVNLSFVDNLPPGMVVAGPANASTDCENPLLPATLTAEPGTSVISLSALGTVAFPALAAGATCTVTVDVVGGALGALGNTSQELTSTVGLELRSSGKASAVLTVTGGLDENLLITKSFLDDPVAPGQTVDLEFTIANGDRFESATGIQFDDTLDPLGALVGLAPSGGLPTDPCGVGSSLAFASGILSLAGGSLPPEGSCTFVVTLLVPTLPMGAPDGQFMNTTTAVSGTLGGSPVTGNVATDTLYVVLFPILTKEFTDDPVGAGDQVTLEFTITNPSSSAMSNIEFIDELTAGTTAGGQPTNGFLPFPVTVSLPPDPDPPCNGSSSLALIFIPTGSDRQGLSLTGGSLAAGASCTFSVQVTIPDGFPAGAYTNTTEEITADVDAFETSVTGPPASDDVVVLAGPSLIKEFIDDPASPGSTVTLEFTLTYDPPPLPEPLVAGDATDIEFTDNLTAVISGLEATGLPLNDVCGAGSQISGTSSLSFTGGVLSPGESCTFQVTLLVPMSAPAGSYTNTTSSVTATVNDLTVAENAASDDLEVAGLKLVKSFTDDPVLPGDTVNLEFTIQNISTYETATNIFFQDDLDEVLEGLTALGLPLNDVCGTGSTLLGSAGDTLLTFFFGTLAPGETCTFDLDLQVPAGAASDTYVNRTKNFAGTIGGSFKVFENASDELIVTDQLLLLTKSFLDDPVAPGGTADLEFTLTNLSDTDPITAISFDDDLESVLAGLAPSGILPPACGGSLSFSMGVLGLTGASLPADSTCSFIVELAVPASAALGSVATNTTTEVNGTLGGLPVSGDPAIDELRIGVLALSKAFSGPVGPGSVATLTFSIVNQDATAPSPGELGFTDDLEATLAGLVAVGLPVSDVCGPGSTVSGTSVVALAGGSLGPGASCTFEVTVLAPADASAGTYPNTTSELFAEGGLPVGPPATADLVVLELPPAITIQKSTNGLDADVPPGPALLVGLPVSWTYEVSNVGGQPLTSVTVTDDQGVTVACPQSTLAAGESMTCTAAGTVVAGQYANVGVAAARLPDDSLVGASDPSHYFGLTEVAVEIEKSTNGEDADSPPGPSLPVGGPVSWTYEVTNVGSQTLSDIVVTDDQGVAVSCPQATLAPSTSMTCTASGAVAVGQYANLGSVTAKLPGDVTVVDSDPSHYFGQTIQIEKSTNGEDADAAPGPLVPVGDPIDWLYVVSNPGPETVTGVTVTDDQGVTVTCPTTTLEAGESMECTASGTSVFGQYENLGTVQATLPLGGTVTDSDPSHYFGEVLRIEKSTNGEDADNPPGPSIDFGTAVNWEYVVTNLGTDDLTDVQVTDDQGVTVTCPQTTLTGGESMTCTASGTAIAGPYANLGTVEATLPGSIVTTAADPSHYFGQVLRIEKSTNGIDADDPPGPDIVFGQPVNWEYVVTNLGTDPLTEVTVNDDQGVMVTCPQDTLAAGESIICDASGTAEAGQYSNLGTANATLTTGGSGDPGGGIGFSDSDRSHYFGQPLQIEKLTAGVDADVPPGPPQPVGGTVNWSYVLTNIGTETLTEIAVTDDQGVEVTCPQEMLAGGESMTCTGSGIVVLGQYANIGTAEGDLPTEERVTASDPSHYRGDLSDLELEFMDVYDPLEAGTVQLWELKVTSQGPTVATQVTLEQQLPPGATFLGVEPADLSCSLLAGVLVSCDLGTMEPGDMVALTVGAFTDHRLDGTIGSNAQVTAQAGDPDPSDNSGAEVSVAVRTRAMVATEQAGTPPVPRLAILAKEADSTLGLIFADAAGGASREYTVLGTDLADVDMTGVPDFGDTPSPEVAVLGLSYVTAGAIEVFVVDADSQALLGAHAPAGSWTPIGIESLPNFGDSPAPELAILARNNTDGRAHVLVIDAASGTTVVDNTLVSLGTDDFPLGLARVPDFFGAPTPQLAIVSRNTTSGDTTLTLFEPQSVTTNSVSLGPGLYPLGLTSVDHFTGPMMPPSAEVAVLARRVSDGELVVEVVEGSTLTAAGTVLFDKDLLPGPTLGVPNFSGLPSPELAVMGRKGTDLVTEIRDAGDGTVVNTFTVASPPSVPIPLALTLHPDFSGGGAEELSELFEYLGFPAEVSVFDVVLGGPIHSFFLP